MHFCTDDALITNSEIEGYIANWPHGTIMLVNNSLLTMSIDKALQRWNLILGCFSIYCKESCFVKIIQRLKNDVNKTAER